MRTELPTVEEIVATGKRLTDLKIAAHPTVSITVTAKGDITFRMLLHEIYESFESSTLEGLEHAGREAIANNDPEKELREQAASFGYDLVKKDSALIETLKGSLPDGGAPPMPVALKTDLCGEVQS